MKKFLIVLLTIVFILGLSGTTMAWWGSKPKPCPDCPPAVECPPAAECPDFEELQEQQPGYWLHITAPDPDYIWLGGQEKFEKGGESANAPDSEPSDNDDGDTDHGHGHHGGHGHGHGHNRK